MTMDDPRRDRQVESWMRAEAPVHAPDRLRDTIRSELAEICQESGPAILMRREMLLSPARAVLAAAIILGFGVIAGGLLGIRGSSGTVDRPSPTILPASSPTALPSPSPSPIPAPTLAGSALAAGPTTTGALVPALQFSVPSGWVKTDDRRLAYRVSPADAGYLRQGDGAVYFDGVAVYVGPKAGQPDGTIAPIAGVGTTSADLAAWLSTRPQLTTTEPVRTTLAGRPAYRLDFSLSPQAGDLCNMPCANLLDSPDGAQSYRFGIEGPWNGRAYLLDAPDGTTVMITVEDVDGKGFRRGIAGRPADPRLDDVRAVIRTQLAPRSGSRGRRCRGPRPA